MSDDPTPWRDVLGDVPPELGELVRDLDAPPPLPPAIRLQVRSRLPRPVSAPPPWTRWIGPSAFATAALTAGLVLWLFRPTPGLETTIAPEPNVPVPVPVPVPATAPAPASNTVPVPVPVPVPASDTAPASASVSGSDTAPAASDPAIDAFDAIPPVDELPPAAPPPELTRNASSIAAVLRQHRTAIARCAASLSPTDRVRVEARATIAADGHVQRVTVTGGPRPVCACVEQEIATWRFGPASESTTISVPFVFAGPEPPAPASPTATGTLTINTLPWSRVYMNGQYVGITPIANLRVPEGDHELRMEPEGLPASTIRVTVTAGETQRIVRRLYP